MCSKEKRQSSGYRKFEKSRVREIGSLLHLLGLLCMICFRHVSLQELF